MERECLDCGTALRGRSDKKFCDDQCRSHYNNRMKAGMNSSMKSVNSILRKNHAILSSLCPENKIRIKKDDLLKKGFNPDYHTHLHHTQNGNIYYFCYEYGFLFTGNHEILIVKKWKSNEY